MENKERIIDGKKYIMQNIAFELLKTNSLPRYIRLNVVRIKRNVWVEEKSIRKYLNFKSFLEGNYLVMNKMAQELSLEQRTMERIIKDFKPEGMLCSLGNKNRTYIPKKFIQIYKKQAVDFEKSSDYIDSKEIMRLLNISETVLIKVRQQGWIGKTYSKSNLYYNKKEKVLFLKDEIEKEDRYILENELIPMQEAKKYYPYMQEVHRGTVYYLLKRYKIKAFERKYKVRKEHSAKYIPLSIVMEYVESIDKTLIIDIEDPMEILNEGFKLLEIPLKVLETMNLFKRYSVQSVSNSNGNNRSRRLIARSYINRAKTFCKVLVKELHRYSDAELELLYKSPELNQDDKKILTRFLNFVKEQMDPTFKNIYSFKDVKIKKTEVEDIYDFQTFFAFYKMAKDLSRNVNKAINDRVYASAWLYIALTTVNGWRPSDLKLLPRIDLGFLGLNSLDTLVYRTLSNEETTLIIDQINSLKLTHFEVSKTQFRRNFYVNDSLRKAIATAYVICQLHSLVAGDEEIINFNTKFNQPYKRVWKMFFDDDRFMDFNTLKMNRSLITHLHNNIKDKTGDSYVAYELARALRNHEIPESLDEREFNETTKIYIRQVSREGFFDKALVELFDRGEFGYLYYLISEGAENENGDGEKLTLTEETLLIKHIQNQLTPSQLEIMAQFMSFSESKRTTLALEVSKRSQEDLRRIVNQLYLGHMPSKDLGVQCYKYPNCPFPTQNNCKTCMYSIPYAAILGSIARDLSVRIESILNQTNYANIQRDRSIIHNLMEKVGEAIQDFGIEFVGSYIDLGSLRKQLINVAERIKSVERMHFKSI
ncbi:cell division protein FtsL [Bacillus tropicus]|uniref:Cell division protein FtsL n=1 Tax=Bacillus tropicus TaxID=2026188 RepID=A0ABD7ZL05_9BACI|nr:cell division protein FtsL [Bacillus tropicus]WMY13521.1 cell division protein FtsL [Bacillus tropicus]